MDRLSLYQRLKRSLLRLPVTSALILIASALYALTIYLATFDPFFFKENRYPGALTGMQLTAFPEVHGHFDLWEGEVWRLLFNVMHHGGLGHLLMNSCSLWILGDILEKRMGAIRYLLFFVVAGYASVLAQSLIGGDPIGMSGAICAVFGYLIVMRNYDAGLAERMTPAMVKFGLACLVVFVPLTAFGFLSIANLAHFVGLGYGAVIAWASKKRPSSIAWQRKSAFAAVHVAIAVLTLAGMSPLWNGRYYAWLAIREMRAADDKGSDGAQESAQKQLELWKKATDWSPDIAVAWLARAEFAAFEDADSERAWQIALKGLRLNRTDEELDQLVRNLWSGWQSNPERCDLALLELQKIFGEEADAWIERLDLKPATPPAAPVDVQKLLSLLEEQSSDQPRRQTLDVVLDVPDHVAGITSPHPPQFEPGQVDPDAVDSAVLGLTL